MDNISFKRHRFPPDIIRYAVWLYARFNLNYRDGEDLFAERGSDISYESVRRWFLKFDTLVARSTVCILPPSISKRIEGYRWQSFNPPAGNTRAKLISAGVGFGL